MSGDPVESVVDLFGGTNAAPIVASPETLIVSRLDVPEKLTNETMNYFAWPDRGNPVEVDMATRNRIVAMLADDHTYRWTMHSMCIPRPGVKLRFMKAGDEVDLYLCFECLTMIVRTHDGHVTSAMFDGRRLADAVKPLFADDAAFQHLKVDDLPRGGLRGDD